MTYTVAVRALCEFTAKRGDLDLRFTPSATAQEGMAGHALAASRRGAAYEREVSLWAEHGPLRVRGRADGYDPEDNRLDEVKTVRGALENVGANRRALHRAQAMTYGAMLARARGLARLRVAVVYLDVQTLQETVLEEEVDAQALDAFFAAQCERFIAWARQEAAHRAARDAALARLPFAHASLRAGQRALAAQVWHAAAAGRTLLAQAPTGVGKTMGTLFPMLRAVPAQQLDKVIYLAAKTPGRALALGALRSLLAPASSGDGAAPVRVVELIAREKACEHPDKACHGESCPLARGFFDRLPAARQAAVDAADGATGEIASPGPGGEASTTALSPGPGGQACAAAVSPTPTPPRLLDAAVVRAVAREHAVCPYYLSHELVRWADVVVGDYHYWFDASGLLHGLALAEDWRVGLLVDEAHNLVPRAREMYSATLRRDALGAAQAASPPELDAVLVRLARQWDGLAARQAADYAAHDTLPPLLTGALQALVDAVGDLQARAGAAAAPLAPAVLDLYFRALHFARLAESFGRHSLFDVTREAGGNAVLCLRNLVPAPFVGPRLQAAHTATLFSATLTPWRYHADLLGLPAQAGWLDVESPFDPGQLAVRVQPLSTRWLDRDDTLDALVDVLARQYRAAPGNYLAFFSSFDYLARAVARLAQCQPGIPTWSQERGMAEHERTAFLDRFVPGGRGIAFAVLGGAFAEAIDLPGDRLVGAFIATLGMPQVNAVNEHIRARFEQLFGAGHDYAYLYPGLQKVVQAAGRVIRTHDDRGVVHLIDDRFRRPDIRRLLPAWWDVRLPPH